MRVSVFTEETKERDSPLGFTRQSTVSSAPGFCPRRQHPRGREAGTGVGQLLTGQILPGWEGSGSPNRK